MGIYKSTKKRKDGKPRWGYNLYVGTDPKTGKEKRLTSEKFKTRREATLEHNRIKMALEDGSYSPFDSKKIRVKELMDDFIDYYARTGVTESTVRIVNQGMNKHVVGKLGEYYVSEITPEDCYRFMEYLGLNLKKPDKYKYYLSQLLEFAKTKGHINRNPMNDISNLKKTVDNSNDGDEVVPEPKYYTEQEMKTLLSHMETKLPHHKYTFFLLLAYTGLRKGEALALYKDDIDIVNHRITIDKTLTTNRVGKIVVSKGTKSRSRNLDALTVLPLNPVIIPTLTHHIKKRPKGTSSNFFFGSIHHQSTNGHFNPSTPDKWLTTYYNKYWDELKALGINHRISCHGFRHSYTSILTAKNYNPDVIRQLLRHTDVKTTNIYQHYSIETIEHLMGKTKKELDI